jgi:putative DNA primase/helicase
VQLFDAWVAKARAVPIEREIERRGIALKRVGAEHVGPCPKCGGDDRFAINTAKGVWNCRGCGKGGDVIELVQHLDDVGFVGACAKLTGSPPPKPNGKGRAAPLLKKVKIAEFLYHDQDGNVVAAQERIEYQNPDGTFVLKDHKHKKKFIQKRPDPDRPGKWVNQVTDADGKPLIPVVPYRLPQLIEAISNDHLVAVVEGEAKADLLASWNVAATCNAGGATHWKPEHAAFLKGADVVLVPDYDDVGFQHINIVGASLVGIAKRVRVLILPGLRPKNDIVDWAHSGGTREQLDELIARAPDWEPAPVDKASEKKAEATQSEDELLTALAKMPKGVAFGRERKRLAKELGVGREDIDAEIEARRVEAETIALLHGHWYVEPWPEPVDGDALIRDIIRKLRKHVVMSHGLALAVALWLILAWVHDDVATHSPILDVTSAEPGSGKTTTLGVLSFLMPRAITAVDVSKAALYRSIQRWQPSFAIDQFDTVLAAKTDNAAELGAVINSGHTRGTGVLRCITDEHTPELFPTFCPKAIGMIGRKMPPATLGRCISIELRRRKKSEQIVKFKHEDDSEFADLRRRLCRYALDNAETLRDCAPSMPDQFDDRREDNWRVQFAIADLAGEDWGDQARAAAIETEKGSDSRTAGVHLLAAIKAIRDSIEDDAIGSEELCSKLAEDPTSEWAEWGKARKPITQVQLKNLLKPYRISPGPVRPKRLGGKQVRGYQFSWFEDAWERNL